MDTTTFLMYRITMAFVLIVVMVVMCNLIEKAIPWVAKYRGKIAHRNGNILTLGKSIFQREE